MSQVQRAYGVQARTVRKIPRLLALSRMQSYPGHLNGRRLSRGRRQARGTSLPLRQGILLLLQLSGMQIRHLVQTGAEAVSPVQRPVPGGKILEEDRPLHCLPEKRMRVLGRSENRSSGAGSKSRRRDLKEGICKKNSNGITANALRSPSYCMPLFS